MKKYHKTQGLLLLILCLALTGCGDSAEDTGTTEADTAESTEVKESSAADQDTYEMLAETKIVLQRKKAELTLEYGHYENIILNQSAQYFVKKDVMPDLSSGNQSDAETEYTPAKYPKLNPDYQADISIPEIDDSELESRIAELQIENQELTAQISYLTEQIAVYKALCGYE